MMHANLMNCDVECKKKEPGMRQGKTGHNQSTESKPSPVTGIMTKRCPTQTLQKCVGGSQSRGQTRATDRQPVGVSRIQKRYDKKHWIQEGPMISLWRNNQTWGVCREHAKLIF